jgi:hypothetical protein
MVVSVVGGVVVVASEPIVAVVTPCAAVVPSELPVVTVVPIPDVEVVIMLEFKQVPFNQNPS